MKKILVINVPGPLNKGSMAVTMSLIRNLNARNPNLRITLSTPHFEIDQKLYRNEHVKVTGHPFYRETGNTVTTLLFSAVFSTIAFFRYVFSVILQRSSIVENAYGEYDIIIDLDVDGLNDYYHGLFEVLTCLLNAFFWKLLLKKPLILIATSIGPLFSPISRFMAKFVLNRADIITFRESYSMDYIRKLGITRPKMKLTADLAFSLVPVAKNRIDEIFRAEGIPLYHKPIIGLVPSQFASLNIFPRIKEKSQKHDRYVALLAKVAIYLIDQLGAFVLLIPHSVDPKHDDRALCRAIYETIGQRNENIKMLKGEYAADELKGVIGNCSLLISFLMHPSIHACSLAVPVVAAGYSRSARVYGIIGRMMGQEKCIVNFENLGFDELFLELTERINYVWNYRPLIHEELVERSRIARKLSLSNFDFVESLFVETARK